MIPDSNDSTSRVRGVEWLLVGLLGFNLAWTTLCLGGYRPETMVVTSLLNVLLLAVHLLGRALERPPRGFHWAGWCFLPFLIYATWNVFQVTPVRWLGWHDWLWWAQMIGVFWVVLNDIRGRNPRAVLLGIIAVLGLVIVMMAAYQRYVDSSWLMMGREQADQYEGRASGAFGIPNSLAAFLILLLPGVWVLACRRGATAGQRVLFGYLGLCFLFGLILSVSRGGWLALGGALMAWPLFLSRWSWWKRLAGVVVVMGLIAALGWGLWKVNPTARERFQHMVAESGEWTRPIMWRGAWNLFKEDPITGSGAGSYNILFEKYRPANYQHQPEWTHNDYLNTLSDYGLLGFGLFFGAVASVMIFSGRKVGRHEPRGRVAFWDFPLFWQAVGIGLLAFGAQLMVDFHFKIPALAMLAAVLVALKIPANVSSDAKEAPRRAILRRAMLVAVAAVVLGGGIWWVNPHYRAEAHRYSARQDLDKLWRLDEQDPDYAEILTRSLRGLRDATAIDATNAQAWADRAYATALRARIETVSAKVIGAEAEGWAVRARDLAPVVPEYWIRLAVAKDMQGEWIPAGRDMAKAISLAPASAFGWYYQAYHLSLKPTGLPLARAAVAYCLRLDPSNQAAQRLRQKLATEN